MSVATDDVDIDRAGLAGGRAPANADGDPACPCDDGGLGKDGIED